MQAGEIEFQLDDQVIVATAGTFLYSPQGQQHCFTNRSAMPATLLVWVTPAGFEHFIAAVGKIPEAQVNPNATLTPDDLNKILATAPQYGIEIIPPAA